MRLFVKWPKLVGVIFFKRYGNLILFTVCVCFIRVEPKQSLYYTSDPLHKLRIFLFICRNLEGNFGFTRICWRIIIQTYGAGGSKETKSVSCSINIGSIFTRKSTLRPYFQSRYQKASWKGNFLSSSVIKMQTLIMVN